MKLVWSWNLSWSWGGRHSITLNLVWSLVFQEEISKSGLKFEANPTFEANNELIVLLPQTKTNTNELIVLLPQTKIGKHQRADCFTTTNQDWKTTTSWLFYYHKPRLENINELIVVLPQIKIGKHKQADCSATTQQDINWLWL